MKPHTRAPVGTNIPTGTPTGDPSGGTLVHMLTPDLNPIEHLWCHFKRQLAKYNPQPNSIHKLWENMVEEWNKISVETCRKLIESMPRRLEAVIKAKGGHTDY